jgi:hypothetical protein
MDGSSFVYRPDWVLPTTGILEFDLVVPRRLQKTSKLLDEGSLESLRDALEKDALPVMVQALCLRRVSSQLCLTCQQALSIFTLLEKAETRRGRAHAKKGGPQGLPSLVELTVFGILLFRIRDYQNIRERFFKTPAPFSSPDRLRSCERMFGCLNIADTLHLSLELRLDLTIHEERQYCRMVLSIAYQEGGRALDPKSFQDCAYGSGSSELLPFPSCAPPDRWVKTGLPQRGVLVMTYLLEADNIRFRRRQSREICGWDI